MYAKATPHALTARQRLVRVVAGGLMLGGSVAVPNVVGWTEATWAFGFLAALTALVFLISAAAGRDYRLELGRGSAAAAPAGVVVLRGDVISSIESLIAGFFQTIWDGISSFFGTIFQAIANTFAAVFEAPVSAVESSWTSFSNWANGFGPLAPILVVAIIAAVFVISTWAIWLIIKLSVSEGEQTAEEAEEGM